MNDADRSDATRLIQQAKQGEDAALGELFARYRNYIALLARLGLNPELRAKIDPSDVVQETFLHAQRSFPKFIGASEGEFLQWLKAIFVKRLATQRRRFLDTAGRNLRREQSLRAMVDQSSQTLNQAFMAADPSPSENTMRRERGVLLADALARLSPDHREVILLRSLEDHPFTEVAARMGRSLDSVRGLWARAFVKLSEALRQLSGSSAV